LTPSRFQAWLARQAYSLVLRLGVPAYLWRVWARGREEPDYRLHWWQRLGWYDRAYRAQWRGAEGFRDACPVVWVHAVSLGEARAAAPLVHALRRQCPGMRLLLTHTTATGREAGKALLNAEHGDVQTWLPYDSPGAVQRFLRFHRPQVGVLMETEVWPNLQHQALLAQVPMVLANARLSEKSLRQGLRLSALMKPAAQALVAVLAQTDADARRLSQLLHGAPAHGPQALRVCGNVKFDMTPDAALLARGRAWQEALKAQSPGAQLVMAASTREGEEPGLLAAWQAAARAVDARLLIVPRHPQRFDEVAALVQAAGLSLSRRSQWVGDMPDAQALGAQVWLGDSMREMPAYFAASDMALLGGSFAPLGGQNLIEAAACGCPIVVGPSTFNFEEATELSLAADAARRAQDWPDGVTKALGWLQEGTASERQARCLAFAQAHQGAADLMAREILLRLSPAGRATRGGA
jgi:3-deoxy-D-manno-octulosonic-acid transferase